MYSTHNEDRSTIGERFIKKLYAIIYKTITANDSKSYLVFLNKLVDQYNNTYHHSVNKKPINADYSALTEKIETNFMIKFMIESELLSIRIFLVKVTLKINEEKYLSILF